MKKNKITIFLILLLGALLIPLTAHAAKAEKQDAEIEIAPTVYHDPSGYLMRNRSAHVFGRMLVTGASEIAVGADGRMELTGSPDGMELVFQYDTALFGHIADDPTTVIQGADVALGASVRRGALVVQTTNPYHGAYKTVYTITDLSRSHPQGITVYSTGTDTLRTGISIRIFFLMVSEGMYVTQLYEFRIKPLESPSLILDLSADETDEMPFLNDGDTSTTGFRVYLNQNQVRVSHNGGAWRVIEEHDEFEASGRYRVITEYPSGKREQMSIYVLPSREEICMAYFGSASEVFVDEADRIFSDREYPTYTTACIPFQCVGDELPALVGVIKNVTTGEEINVDDRNNQTPLYLAEAGLYRVELKTGAAGGSCYFFVADLIVTEAAGKSVNQEALEGFISKHGSANGYVYILVPYESEHILAKNPANGDVLEVAHGVPLEEQLSPGTYVISEYTSGNLFSYEIVITEKTDTAAKDEASPSDEQPSGGCTAACPHPFIVLGAVWTAMATTFVKQKGEKQSCE